jgi:general L-amino acid transport system permease protein
MMGFGAWCRKRLFPDALNGVVSLAVLAVLAFLLYALCRWALFSAQWQVITQNIRFLMAGSLPSPDIWRAWTAGAIFMFMTGLSLGKLLPIRRIPLLLGGLLLLALAIAAMTVIGQPQWALVLALAAAANTGWLCAAHPRSTSTLLGTAWVVTTIVMWNILIPGESKAVGGLLLGLLITMVAVIFSFPVGVALALGRTSRLPGIRLTCVCYIELIRSLPLISILYWAWMVVPLILPGDVRISDLVRGAVGFTLFYAAYVAEYVRGGLQGVPRDQVNAAKSLGLNTFSSMYHIVLPQALRSVLPALVGNVLDIFNNVPLLFIIGLTEFVRAGQVLLSNPQHSGQMYEVYVFMFAVYLAMATLLSWSSRVVEARLGYH